MLREQETPLQDVQYLLPDRNCQTCNRVLEIELRENEDGGTEEIFYFCGHRECPMHGESQ